MAAAAVERACADTPAAGAATGCALHLVKLVCWSDNRRGLMEVVQSLTAHKLLRACSMSHLGFRLVGGSHNAGLSDLARLPESTRPAEENTTDMVHFSPLRRLGHGPLPPPAAAPTAAPH